MASQIERICITQISRWLDVGIVLLLYGGAGWFQTPGPGRGRWIPEVVRTANPGRVLVFVPQNTL